MNASNFTNILDRTSTDGLIHDTVFNLFPGAILEGSKDNYISFDLDSAFIGSIKFYLNVSADLVNVKIFVTTQSFETRELVIFS